MAEDPEGRFLDSLRGPGPTGDEAHLPRIAVGIARLDALVLESQSRAGAAERDGGLADVLGFGHDEGEPMGRQSRRAGGRLDREDDRRRVELEDGDTVSLLDGGPPSSAS